MKKNAVVYLLSIAFALSVRIISSLVSGGSEQFRLVYSSLVLPPFAPPAIVFPIVWSILYILMGIAAARVFLNEQPCKQSERSFALLAYFFQLILNFLWSVVFFKFGSVLGAFIVICLLVCLVAICVNLFYNVDKLSAYLLIPYLLWLVFATILNASIMFLNI